MKKFIPLAMLPLLLNATPTTLWTLSEGLANPESVTYDTTTKNYFVSNVNGAGNSVDANGYISRVDAEGKLITAKWIEGLNAPKGIAIVGNTLWVSDITELVEIDIAQAKIVKKIPVAGAVFLNDVTAKDTQVYVSDTLGNQIYKYDGTTVTALGDSTVSYESPNGLKIDGDKLLVASWGLITSFAETPQPAGSLYSLDLNGKNKTAISGNFGNLDGLEKSGTDFIVTDWVAGKLYKVSATGENETLLISTQGTADIGLGPAAEGKTTVVLPQMNDSTVTAYEL